MPKQLAQRDTRFARALAGETLRRFGQLDALLREFVRKQPAPHRAGPTLEILLAGACELLFLDVPAHAAVDAANRLAANDKMAVHFKPLINATLRRISRQGADILSKQDSERVNAPDWLWNSWCEHYGEETARAFARIHVLVPPLDLNVKSASAIATLGGDSRMLPGKIVRIREPGATDALPGYSGGAWWVQDFAASLPARLLGNVRGKTVVDLCAAPGGKTAQLALAGAHVIAVERDSRRMARLRANLDRLGYSANLVEGDVLDVSRSLRAERVLLDAPCSATGTIRRHPELPWIKGASDVNACARNASELLDSAAEIVTPGGLLVFAVCSLEREECEAQISGFLRGRDDFCRVPVSAAETFGMAELVTAEGDLRTLPCHLAHEGGMDGFYAARLQRLR